MPRPPGSWQGRRAARLRARSRCTQGEDLPRSQHRLVAPTGSAITDQLSPDRVMIGGPSSPEGEASIAVLKTRGRMANPL